MSAEKPTETATPPVLKVRGLKKHFELGHSFFGSASSYVYAVDGLDFEINRGETLGLVGESGCGKSTTGRTVIRLIEPTAGSIQLNGKEITGLDRKAMKRVRRELQIIFQDPYASLNPRLKAASIVAEPLKVHGLGNGKEQQERVAALFDRVGLHPRQMAAYPHEFSGGQRQRLGIARALSLNPQLIIGDEPVSALDVSIQAQVINLLSDLQAEYNLSYLFIAHDLAVVKHISHRVAVMYLGRIVEYAPKPELFSRPLHPYTELLMAAVAIPDPRRKRKPTKLVGDVPSPINPPQGCHFHPRCPYAEERCKKEAPLLRDVGGGHQVACHLR